MRQTTAAIVVGVIAAAALLVGAAPSKSSYFVHFSDPHVDFGYTPGSPTTCALQKMGWPCCHAWSTNTSPCELAPRFGHRNCDPPRETVEQIVEQAAKLYPAPLLVLLTGDLASHDAFNEVPDRIAEKWDWMFGLVRRCFGADVPIVSTIGNHDVFPADQASHNATDPVVTALLAVLEKHGVVHPDVPDEALFARYGYYKAAIRGTDVDAVVMNNILDLTQNRLTPPDIDDPAGMYSFVERAVEDSVRAGRRVWLVGHVAPADSMERARAVVFHERLVARFGTNGTIAGAFFGHTHRDQFVLAGMQSLQDKARAVSMLAPGATPIGGINPGIRVVECDAATLELKDWHQYRVNMSRANRENVLTLEHAYDFRAAYGVPDLSAASFQQIAARCLTDEPFAVAFTNNMLTQPGAARSCDTACRKNLYCSLSFSGSQLRNKCMLTNTEQLVRIANRFISSNSNNKK